MNTDITFIIADNQDITRMGMHGYISAIFSGCRMIDVTDKKELMLALVECNDSSFLSVTSIMRHPLTIHCLTSMV